MRVEVTEAANPSLDTWDNEYYRMYGENYKRMFSTSYTMLAANETETDMLDEAYRVWCGEMKTVGISGLLELTNIPNALEIAFEGLFKGKEYMTEKKRREAITYLIQEMTVESLNEKYVENVSDALEKTDSENWKKQKAYLMK